MRISMIFGVGMKDGIESYSEELCRTLGEYGIEIKKYPITEGVLHLVRRVVRDNIDLVHIQHEYSYFKPRPFGITALILLALLRLLRKKIVVTLHTVYPFNGFENYIPSKYRKYNFILKHIAKIMFLIITKILAKLSSHVIVLTPEGKRILETEYRINNLTFIPYGMHKSKIYDYKDAKDKLKLSNKKVLMCFGYPYPNKGFQYAIEAVYELVKMGYKDIILLLQDTRLIHDYRKCEEYANMLKNLVQRRGLFSYVRFIPFISEDVLSLYLSAVDIFIYPFEPRIASSSALMKTLYYGKPHILSDIPSFGFLKNLKLKNIRFVKPMSPNEIAKAILELLNESPSNDKKLLDMFSWENVGKMHVRLYASLLDKSPSRSNSKLGKFFASEI
jgi:glycosyltransferase involved in cell wall biosynthesis